MSNTNIIELNGKRYDAGSGVLLDNTKDHTVSVTVSARPVKAAPRALDSIIHNAKAHSAKIHTHSSTTAAVAKNISHKTTIATHAPHHVIAHKTEHAQTLMRTAVKKPSPSFKAQLRVQSPTTSRLSTPAHALPTKHSTVDIGRLSRAQQAAKSSAISRFGTTNRSAFTKHLRPLAVHAAPTTTTQHVVEPVSAFDAAVANATSHEQAPPHIAKQRRIKSRTLNFVAAGAAFLLIIAFIAYQNIPNLEVRLASTRAGFKATLPSFRPSGFAFSEPIQFGSGEVTIGFHSNSDRRSYNIIERPSNWDSQTLLDSFVASTGQSYQTVQNGGRLIYMYGDGNATWVNGNIWYRLIGNSNLNTNQLINIATSM